MSSNQSFQLPDLLGIMSGLELRTNRHCRFATDASEKWFVEASKASQPQTLPDVGALPSMTTMRLPLLSDAELKYLRSTKLGLLCALCFPMCDAPQLRAMTDLVTLLFYSSIRHSRVQGQASSEDSESPVERPNTYLKGVLGSLEEQGLLRQLKQPLLKSALAKASRSWTERCAQSIQALLDAQAGAPPPIPPPPSSSLRLKQGESKSNALEDYTEWRRELHGTSMILDFAELLEIFEFPQAQPPLCYKIARLKRAFLDVLAFSMDVASYQLTQARHSANPSIRADLNLVSILQTQKRLSLQGAMNLAGNMIREAYAEFRAAEKDILDFLEPPPQETLLPTAKMRLTASMTNLGASLSSSASTFFGWLASASEKNGGQTSPRNLAVPNLGNAPSISVSHSYSPPPSPSPSPSPSSSTYSLALESNTTATTTKRYIEALKDCLVGTLHWAYETELFFGKKGSEVRAFGWVFVDQVPVIPEE
ncbi:hypothetical protein CVT26_012718 [Gymnopilus dilepis]|uniref:Uncharacterized protein n=1 Tax=Gymnopilus dilepis TaxID=231916 RepID=A0A409YPE4_9AGAR|nr:hypothetical protein CVT26_012718 [Gymnopilus dilepis]